MSALSGTLLNALTVLVGGLLGTVLGDRLSERLRENTVNAVGLFTLAMGTKFAIDTSNLLYMLGSIVIGGIIGSLWGVDRRLNGVDPAGPDQPLVWSGEVPLRVARRLAAAGQDVRELLGSTTGGPW